MKNEYLGLNFSFKHTTLVAVIQAVCCWQPHLCILLILVQFWPNARNFRSRSFISKESFIYSWFYIGKWRINYLFVSYWWWRWNTVSSRTVQMMVSIILSKSFVWKMNIETTFRTHIDSITKPQVIPILKSSIFSLSDEDWKLKFNFIAEKCNR